MTDQVEETSYPLRWRAVSVLTSFPVILTVAYLAVVGAVASGIDAQRYAGIMIGFFIALPGLAGFIMYLRGRISDLEIRERGEREPILIIGMVASLLGVYVLYLASAPEAVFRLGVLQLLTLIVVFWINGFWKISVHAISWGAALPPIFVFRPVLGIALMPFAFLMSLSRFKLDCHTVPQVVIGFLGGAVMAGALFVPFL